VSNVFKSTIVTLKPHSILNYSSVYIVTLRDNITDLVGNNVKEYRWEFVTINKTDLDGDGYNDTSELQCGSDPYDPMSTPIEIDGDGYTNSYEQKYGPDPYDPLSTPLDLDADGWNNAFETQAGSDPYDPLSTPMDRDGDGVPNDEDAYPDDPDRWKAAEETKSGGIWWVVVLIGGALILGTVAVLVIMRKKKAGKCEKGEDVFVLSMEDGPRLQE